MSLHFQANNNHKPPVTEKKSHKFLDNLVLYQEPSTHFLTEEDNIEYTKHQEAKIIAKAYMVKGSMFMMNHYENVKDPVVLTEAIKALDEVKEYMTANYLRRVLWRLEEEVKEENQQKHYIFHRAS